MEKCGEKCGHCGSFHSGVCAMVKAIEYFPNGMVKRVEYHDRAWLPADQHKGTVTISPRAAHWVSSFNQASGQSNNCEQDEGA